MKYYSIYITNTVDFFTYSSEVELKIGSKVLISFQNKEKVGIVIKEELGKEYSFKVLKVKRVLENEIVFSKPFIKLLLWIKDYYLVGFDQIYTAAIPQEIKIKYVDKYILNSEIRDILDKKIEDNEILKYIAEKEWIGQATLRKFFGKDRVKQFLSENQLFVKDKKYRLNDKVAINKELIDYFENKKEITRTTLESKFELKEIEKLLKAKEILLMRKIKKSDIDRLKSKVEIKREIPPTTLNKKQNHIKEEILNSDKKYFLLRGVTGSGKTEIYIHLIREGLGKGEGAIFLVPEISLTPQMIERFSKEFGDEVAILHSRLSKIERAKEWYSIYSGEKKVVLGVRSAIFAPVQNLKLIIIDEEHENSYKQDSSPRYHAKYVALKRAELEKAKVVLGSATPSIESYYYAKTGVFKLLEIENRYKDATIPDIDIVDMRAENNSFFSEKLLDEIRKRLLKKEQVILLLNRKGYSTLVQCKSCGYIEECKHCSINLNYYAGIDRLKCNYCGISRKYTHSCSNCGSNNIDFSGQGVERVEEELKKIFPVNIIRVDGDVAKERDFYSKMYYDFLNKKYDIMIGTQMISRGLHFPEVTLVGVINADTVMSIPDFRVGERTYQMLTQVAGRAGRGKKKGEVIIQTYQPTNYVIEKIQENSYINFYEKEIEKRELLFYPPFSKIINIGISSEKEEGLEIFCKEFYERIKSDEIEIYGPMRAMVYRVKGRYRYNIFIKGEREKINRYKKLLFENYKELSKDKKYRIVIDVDPVNLV